MAEGVAWGRYPLPQYRLTGHRNGVHPITALSNGGRSLQVETQSQALEILLVCAGPQHLPYDLLQSKILEFLVRHSISTARSLLFSVLRCSLRTR